MSHIHELIDFTVAVYIVYENKVLLVDHKKLKTWMPIGGHIELDEDLDEALLREIQEECGLDVEIFDADRPDIHDPGVKPLITPQYMDIHDIMETHRHIGMVYFARAKTDQAQLAEGEHHDIRWFTKDELSAPIFNIRPFIRYYCEQALERINT